MNPKFISLGQISWTPDSYFWFYSWLSHRHSNSTFWVLPFSKTILPSNHLLKPEAWGLSNSLESAADATSEADRSCGGKRCEGVMWVGGHRFSGELFCLHMSSCLRRPGQVIWWIWDSVFSHVKGRIRPGHQFSVFSPSIPEKYNPILSVNSSSLKRWLSECVWVCGSSFPPGAYVVVAGVCSGCRGVPP